MNVKQAAEDLELAVATVYALCQAGKIPHERHGLGRGTIRITEAGLAEYRRRTTFDGAPAPPVARPRRAGGTAIPDIIGPLLAARRSHSP